MTDPDAETLIGSFGLTHQLIRMQTDGLSHKDSLLQPPFRGNCLNWVLGHILVGRNTALKLMQETLIWDEAERIAAALKCTTPEELATVVPFRGSRRSLGQALASQHWHETYHTGQLELLRQLAGTDDAIV
jgi:hypothetical protein